MSFPGTHHAIRELVEDTVLQTSAARDIMRKAGIRLGGGTTLDSGFISVDLFQQYAKITRTGFDHSQYGSVVTYSSAANSPFPAASTRMLRFWDFRDAQWMRFVGNISEVGPAGGQLFLTLIQDVGTPGTYPSVPFEGGAPSIPADSVGLHDSGWRRIQWLTTPESLEGRRAQTLPWLSNPTGVGGTIGVGLCQILIRRDEDVS